MYHASHQLRETSTTTMHRRECQPECQGRVEAKSKQRRSKYHAPYQLREMPNMSAMPKQRRECQPECLGRVEVKSKQKRNVYRAPYQLREMSTTKPKQRAPDRIFKCF